jgi:polyisoprenoid-binding protein YceI
MKSYLLACLFTLMPAAHAAAASYKQLVLPQSSIRFDTTQMGVPVEGRFQRFSASLDFDPARPEAAKVAVEIDPASIDAGSPDANAEVGGKPWFDFAQFPRARFVSKQLKKTGTDRYELAGVLTLKGKSREMRVPVTVKAAGKQAVFDGVLILKRLDFGIGTGPWADTDTVANDVKVRVRLTATAQ